jgi:hypothetical protein
MQGPDYAGGGFVNLIAELETRLTGSAPSPGLSPNLDGLIPEGATYLLVLFDGLGDLQLTHPAAEPLTVSRRAALDAPFPTTTTVTLATLATGLAPTVHGLLGYQLWLPEQKTVVNTIKWTTLWGDPVQIDHFRFLPYPNTWERVAAAGVEPVVIQPADFEDTPLTKVLYRGCRWEPWSTPRQAVDAALQLAAVPGRLILLYLPQVDFAAHVAGQQSKEYARALETVARIWAEIAARLPRGAVVIGTADHGHVDVPKERRARIPKQDHQGRILSGDPRVVFVHGEGESLADGLPARWIRRAEMEQWWGPGARHPEFDLRTPDGVLLADPGHTVLHRFSDERLIGMHGGLTPKELRIPLLVAG